MSSQGQLFNGTTSTPPPAPQEPERSAAHGPEPAPVWLQRASLVVLVMFCLFIGALMTVLPWSQYYWDRNGWLLAHPTLDTLLEHGWVRGILSGIGLLDIWIGVSELLNYRDYRP